VRASSWPPTRGGQGQPLGDAPSWCDKVGNLKRGGRLERVKPIPGSEHPVGQPGTRPFGRERGEAREGRDHEDGPTTPGGKSLKRRKPKRATACRAPNQCPAGTDSRVEQSPEAGFPNSFSVHFPTVGCHPPLGGGRTAMRYRSALGSRAVGSLVELPGSGLAGRRRGGRQ
jgi:hypothetical protein